MDGYPDPVSKEVFEKAERLIGIKFPYPLYELIKDYDARYPNDPEFQLKMPGEIRIRSVALGAFLSFNPKSSVNIINSYLL